jgi:ribosomal protein S12 methylthiotransferase
MIPKKIHLVSLGCPKNLVDSEMLLSAAVGEGWEIAGGPGEADLLLVNTCGFIREARLESLRCLRKCLRAAAGGRAAVVLAGCMAEVHSSQLEKILPEVDHVIGVGDIDGLREILRTGRSAGGSARRNRKKILFPGSGSPRLLTGRGHSTYVKIGDGCSRRCAFCLIPSIRGKGRSRRPGGIVEEVRQLAAAGVKEVVLVSQDTTSYGRELPGGRAGLAGLLEKVSDVSGIEWIRLMYLYPHGSLMDVFTVMGKLPKIVPYIDLPVQHSSDRMLRIMRRGHGRRLLEELIAHARRKIPGLAVRTTLMVGHPGETEDDFRDLLRFMRRQRFERIGIMKYCDEEGTAAHTLGGKVPGRRVQSRFRRAVDAASRILEDHHRRLAGEELCVMLDAPRGASKWSGRLSTQAPEIDGAVVVSGADPGARPGDIVRVRITGYRGINLFAAVL